MRGDAGHRKGRATRSESSEKTQVLSPLGRVGGRQQALEMPRIACALLRGPGAIPRGHYHQDLVLVGSMGQPNSYKESRDLAECGLLEGVRRRPVQPPIASAPRDGRASFRHHHLISRSSLI